MKMKIIDYKKLLSKYTPKTLEQIRYIADVLVLRLKDKLTIDENKSSIIGLRALTVPAETTQDIMDLMQYDWWIFNGQHHRLTPLDNAKLTISQINTENLNNLVGALNVLFEQRDPKAIKFSFEQKHIFAYQNKKKKVIVGEYGTYQEGLLRAMTDPHIGVIKSVDVVLETINNYKHIPNLRNLAQRKTFFKTQMGELQSKLKVGHLGGILTLKWSKDGRNISLKSKS